MKIQFLIENKTENNRCVAEHGLSIYIEAQGHKILFDAGASDRLIENARALGIDLSRINEVIISHGHYDHTGGVPAFCKKNQKAKIYIHQDAFAPFFGMKNGTMETRTSGIRWTAEEKAEIEPRLYLTNRLHWIDENIMVSGTVPDRPGQKMTGQFFIKEGDTFVPDPMNHEQLLIIREKSGLYIFSGCSHKGVMAAIDYTKEMFPGKKIAGLIAGMHLYTADQATRREVAEQLEREEIPMVMPVHCTGIEGICQIKNLLKDRCVIPSAGSSYECL